MSDPALNYIRHVMHTKGWTAADLARHAGVSHSTINRPLTVPDWPHAISRRTISAVERASGIDASEFIEGFVRAAPSAEESPATGSKRLLPVYDVEVSAGPGAYIEAENHIANMAFDPRYLREIDASKDLSIVRVKGESMEPTLVDNDIVLVDHSKRSLNWDGLFVLRYGDATQVKRIGRSGKRDHVTILSDNRDLYPPVEAAVEDVDVVGKVLWYGRKV